MPAKFLASEARRTCMPLKGKPICSIGGLSCTVVVRKGALPSDHPSLNPSRRPGGVRVRSPRVLSTPGYRVGKV